MRRESTRSTRRARIIYRSRARWLRQYTWRRSRGSGCLICVRRPEGNRRRSLPACSMRGSSCAMRSMRRGRRSSPRMWSAWGSGMPLSPTRRRSACRRCSADILTAFWWMRPAPARGCSARTRRRAASGVRKMSGSVRTGRMRSWTVQMRCSARAGGLCTRPALLRPLRTRGASRAFWRATGSIGSWKSTSMTECRTAFRRGHIMGIKRQVTLIRR